VSSSARQLEGEGEGEEGVGAKDDVAELSRAHLVMDQVYKIG